MNIETQGQMQKIEFSSLEDFYRYITTTPLNETFRWQTLSSTETGSRRNDWFGTNTFEEACEILKNGWTEMSERLKNKLKVEGKFEPTMTSRNVQSVQGYFLCVYKVLFHQFQSRLQEDLKPYVFLLEVQGNGY